MDEQETEKMVAKVTALKAKSREDAKEYIEEVRAKSQHFSHNQQQCLLIMEYALDMDGLDKPLTPANKKLLRDVFALDGNTFWGNFARGRLIMDGEQIEPPDWAKLEMLPRPEKPEEPIPFMLEKSKAAIKDIKPSAKLSERQKLEIARYAALRLIGKEGWQKLVSRPGSAKFVRAFLDDRTWLEDFAWNGLFPKTEHFGRETRPILRELERGNGICNLPLLKKTFSVEIPCLQIVRVLPPGGLGESKRGFPVAFLHVETRKPDIEKDLVRI